MFLLEHGPFWAKNEKEVERKEALNEASDSWKWHIHLATPGM
jgi:hypothetical protein